VADDETSRTVVSYFFRLPDNAMPPPHIASAEILEFELRNPYAAAMVRMTLTA